VLYVRQARDGFRLARSRNNGALCTRWDILVFHDQDIVATREYLATVADAVRPGTFVTGYPVRLTEPQTASLSEDMILQGRLDHLIMAAQRRKILRQFLKDRVYHHARRARLIRAARPKLRGGVFGVCCTDLFRVDGFDENYIGWGNEDDDLGRRLYASGVCGKNVCLRHVPLHLYHAPHHQGGVRKNLEYAHARIPTIRAGNVRAGRGLSSLSAEGRQEPERLH